MGVWKSIADRMKAKKDELQRKAVRKAAETAVDQAGKAMHSAGKAVGRALFGDLDEGEERESAPPATPPDPFAKLKAAEKEKAERERQDRERQREEARQAKERAAAKAKLEKDVDDELAALKKRLGK